MRRPLFGGTLVLSVALCMAAAAQGVRPAATQASPCLDPSSPQCLRSRIDLLSSQLEEANGAIRALRTSLTAVQNSIGPHKGKTKADGGFDDLWAAIDDINARLKALNK